MRTAFSLASAPPLVKNTLFMPSGATSAIRRAASLRSEGRAFPVAVEYLSPEEAARPEVRLYAGSSMFRVALAIENRKNSPMEFSYLAHINYRPVEGGPNEYFLLEGFTDEGAQAHVASPHFQEGLDAMRPLLETRAPRARVPPSSQNRARVRP